MSILNDFRNRKWLSILIISVPLTVFVFAFAINKESLSALSKQLYWIILTLIPISILVVTAIVYYLNKNTKDDTKVSYRDISEIKNAIRSELKNSQNKEEYLELRKQLTKLSNEVSSIKTLELSVSDKQQLFDTIQTKIDSELTLDILKSIDNKYSAEILSSSKYAGLLEDFNDLRGRLSIEIDTLTKRSNLNLAIGSFTTLVAGVVLWFTVVNETFTADSYLSIVSHYIPRITLIVFIEIFAFFFLKLYKANLENIKYYHNELTNIELKIASIKTSLINNQNNVLPEILREISKTERNFILRKGESTVELEKSKNSNTMNVRIFKMLNELISQKK